VYINKTLGYRTKVTIKRFSVFKKEYPYGPNLPFNSYKGKIYAHISGYYYYKPIETNSDRENYKFETNRRSFYYGSEKHFFRSIYNENLTQQGFELKVFPNYRGLKGIQEVKNLHTGLAGKNYFIDCDSIKVIYWHEKNRLPVHAGNYTNRVGVSNEVSTIYRSRAFFTIRENGTSPNVSFIASGPLTKSNSLANSLPKDYDPFSQ
jgi:hypothetical protein